MKPAVRILPFVANLFLLGQIASAQPSLTGVTPGAVAPGKTVELTLQGAKLDGALKIWTSFPAQVEPAADNKAGAAFKCKVTLAPTVQVGIGGIVVASPDGVSDPFLLLVDDLDSVAENNTNRSAATPQELTLPIAVDGVAEGTTFDYFKFSAKAGERVSVEVFAARLGSKMDPVVRLRDATGRELLLVDDDEALGADCRFAFTSPADGQYVLEVSDNRYLAGNRYRLRVGDFPLVTTPFPLGGPRDASVSFGFAGTAIDGVAPLGLSLTDRSRLTSVGAKFPQGKSSGFAVAAVGNLPEVVENEPNDQPAQATSISLPACVNGRFHMPKDRDYFQFAAKQGQRFSCTGLTRSLGSPSFVLLKVLNAAGAVLAETKVSDTDEWSFPFAAPADGVYHLLVEELLMRGGPQHTYRIEIRPADGFSLSLKADKATVTKFIVPQKTGGLAIDVQCTRDGYDGPVTLSIDDPSTPWTLFENVIPAKAASGKFLIGIPSNLPPGELRMLRIVGKAKVGERDVEATLSTLALLRLQTPHFPYPPAWQDGLVQVVAGAEQPPLYELKLAKPTLFFPRLIGTTTYTVALERKNKDFKTPISLIQQNLPGPLAFALKVDKDNYQITLSGPKDLPEGKHAFRLVAHGDLAGRGQILTTEVPIEVITPLAVSVQPAGPIIVGQKQKVTLNVERKGDDPQPVTLKWTKLPAGVTGDAQFMIPADKGSVEVELSAAADATVGKFEALTVEAVTKYGGADLKIESLPTALETKAN